MSLRLNRQELVKLINSIGAAGKDAIELRHELETLEPEAKRVPQTRRASRVEEEEETMEERLTRRVGDLFPNGIPFEKLMDYDYHFTLNELRERCRKAGVGIGGDKKELAAKLVAKGGIEELVEKEEREDLVDLSKQTEWSGKPSELAIPEAYLKDLRYEIIVFARKERGGSDFTFQCREYEQTSAGQWRFGGVIIDTSIKNVKGEVELARLTYHPEVMLVNLGFMVIPAPGVDET